MSNKNHTESEKIIHRLQFELGVTTKTDLAEALGYKSVSAISNWKSRGVDWNRIIQRFPSLDVKYVKTGVKDLPTPEDKVEKVKRLMSEYESRKSERQPSDEEREILLEFLQKQAEALSKGLHRLSYLSQDDRNRRNPD